MLVVLLFMTGVVASSFPEVIQQSTTGNIYSLRADPAGEYLLYVVNNTETYDMKFVKKSEQFGKVHDVKSFAKSSLYLSTTKIEQDSKKQSWFFFRESTSEYEWSSLNLDTNTIYKLTTPPEKEWTAAYTTIIDDVTDRFVYVHYKKVGQNGTENVYQYKLFSCDWDGGNQYLYPIQPQYLVNINLNQLAGTERSLYNVYVSDAFSTAGFYLTSTKHGSKMHAVAASNPLSLFALRDYGSAGWYGLASEYDNSKNQSRVLAFSFDEAESQLLPLCSWGPPAFDFFVVNGTGKTFAFSMGYSSGFVTEDGYWRAVSCDISQPPSTSSAPSLALLGVELGGSNLLTSAFVLTENEFVYWPTVRSDYYGLSGNVTFWKISADPQGDGVTQLDMIDLPFCNSTSCQVSAVPLSTTPTLWKASSTGSNFRYVPKAGEAVSISTGDNEVVFSPFHVFGDTVLWTNSTRSGPDWTGKDVFQTTLDSSLTTVNVASFAGDTYSTFNDGWVPAGLFGYATKKTFEAYETVVLEEETSGKIKLQQLQTYSETEGYSTPSTGRWDDSRKQWMWQATPNSKRTEVVDKLFESVGKGASADVKLVLEGTPSISYWLNDFIPGCLVYVFANDRYGAEKRHGWQLGVIGEKQVCDSGFCFCTSQTQTDRMTDKHGCVFKNFNSLWD
eukprot:m.100177 g.100177  ORF g.100177 m.100177 type:complete len:671 (-) comp22218_c0_seq2:47-2059(-)